MPTRRPVEPGRPAHACAHPSRTHIQASAYYLLRQRALVELHVAQNSTSDYARADGSSLPMMIITPDYTRS